MYAECEREPPHIGYYENEGKEGGGGSEMEIVCAHQLLLICIDNCSFI